MLYHLLLPIVAIVQAPQFVKSNNEPLHETEVLNVFNSFANLANVNKVTYKRKATHLNGKRRNTKHSAEHGIGTNDSDPDVLEANYAVPWDTYIALLIKITSEQLENVRHNVKTCYGLKNEDLEQVDRAFNNSGDEYEHFLQTNLKRIVEKKQFNVTDEFMIDFMDISNYLLQQIISYDLSQVKGKLERATKWYKLVMREKITRQQVKIATNFVEAHLCSNLHICKDRPLYTQYLTEWLRHFLNLSSFNLNNLFAVIPELLEKHMHTLKSNVKFKETVKYIVESGETVHRDTIDFIDEVVNNKKSVVNLQPKALKNGAALLKQLFKLIENNYDITEENENQLTTISNLIQDWMNGGNSDVIVPLEKILQNMEINLKIWPLDQQIRSTLAGKSRQRMKWTNDINTELLGCYYTVTKCETDMTAWRPLLYNIFIQQFPELSHLSEQRLSDQIRVIHRNNRIPKPERERIKQTITPTPPVTSSTVNTTEEQQISDTSLRHSQQANILN
ncbi:uncharacterized protein LOC113226341 [Hyposmocoma kahamanoa]|uniref:uncharacterized protein LOC113226341 n=1 Tax=Hyposmocoma kahamanoa TaxID=1477025 RepID=UPI000E6D8284|nr:uncharacterized protein LOC113226341 [Hyposmocoma kahamanoa]